MPDKPPERIWAFLREGSGAWHTMPLMESDVEYVRADILASQVGAEIAEKEDEHDKELGRWQEAIRDLVIKVSGAPDSMIDGGGDSGDPLDLSLAEITQGLNFLIDQLDDLRANHAAEVEKVWDAAYEVVVDIPHVDLEGKDAVVGVWAALEAIKTRAEAARTDDIKEKKDARM